MQGAWFCPVNSCLATFVNIRWTFFDLPAGDELQQLFDPWYGYALVMNYGTMAFDPTDVIGRI